MLWGAVKEEVGIEMMEVLSHLSSSYDPETKEVWLMIS